MNDKRLFQYEKINHTGKAIRQWALKNNVQLHNTQVVVPDEERKFNLHVVFFFRKNKHIEEYAEKGINEKIRHLYLESLKANEYPDEWLNLVTFEYDSYENVFTRFHGNYFLRMKNGNPVN